MDLLIKNIRIVNADGISDPADILVEDRIIKKIGTNVGTAKKTIDGTGLHAFPGFCDLHSHLRDPGLTHKEDIVSGTRSAAAGGYVAVCCMPNTKPVIDSVETIQYILDKAAEQPVRVMPVASITKGMYGCELTDFRALADAGAVAFSDDGLPVSDDDMIVAAMQEAKKQRVLLMLHEEDLKNRGKGVVHDGVNAQKAGLPGIPRAIEDSMTARDLFYAQQYGARIHICHVSTVGSIELVRRAKMNGVDVTCETGPHYFSLTDEAVATGDPNTKVNPPLREEADRQAVIAGIVDGTVDAIATDHAPHSPEEKAVGYERAPFGLIGFETAFSLAITHLCKTGKVGPEKIAELLSSRPREILGIPGGRLAEGCLADITICDLDKRVTYTRETLESKAQNSPFLCKELYGGVVYTIAGGTIAYDR